MSKRGKITNKRWCRNYDRRKIRRALNRITMGLKPAKAYASSWRGNGRIAYAIRTFNTGLDESDT